MAARGLGKGLDSLIPNALGETKTKKEAVAKAKSEATTEEKGAAHAQLSGQLLAGNVCAPGGTQCLQKGLTGGRRHGGKAPFVLYYNHIVAWNGQNTMFLKKICGLCRECGGCLV